MNKYVIHHPQANVMNKLPASCCTPQDMRRGINYLLTTALLMSFSTISFVSIAQTSAPVKRDHKPAILSIAYFIESANNSINSLNSLLKKDSYRNKITTLNNPVNNELGFSLKNEILTALKPILDKVKRTDPKKFKDVIENFLSNPEENGISSVKKYLPVLGIFSTVLSLVGNLVIAERSITREDLNQFIAKVQQYFSQYEKLNTINEQFGIQLQKLVERSEDIKEELKEFLVDCISTMDKTITKQSLKNIQVEALVQLYYDPQKLQGWLDTTRLKSERLLYPFDAPTSAKLLTSGIKKLQKEFETLYSENYKQLKELIASLKNTIPDLDEEQLAKTNSEIDKLYNDSRQADVTNLNINHVDERMNTVCRIINANK
jgi:DNA polymerase III delta prime subunit